MSKKSSFKGYQRAQTHAEPASAEINQLVAAFNQGQYAEMERLAQHMTARFAHFALGWKALGTAILQQGRYVDALLPLQRAATLSPQDSQPHNNLGNAMMKLHRYREAESSYRHAVKLTPHLAEAHYNLGNALKQQERYSEAESCYRQTLALNSNIAIAHNNLASVLSSQGRFIDAELSYQQALQLDPHCEEALLGLGNARMDKGEMEQAESLFRKVLTHNPNNVSARYHLAQLRKVTPEDENLAALITTEQRIQRGEETLGDGMAIALHYALGKSYTDTGLHAQAFPHFIAGGRLKRATLQYDAAHNTQHIERIMRVFDAQTLARLRGGGNPSSLPIFVVGMPRSGTTLTEQIIASHPDVYGAGELNYLMTIANGGITASPAYPDNIATCQPADLMQWGNEYIQALQQHAPAVRHITDKMPGNFIAIGLIHLILPNAKIIHVSRHPLDNCLSCFTQLFSDGHGFTYDLAELGHYYADYLRLMAHWRSVLPGNAFLDVRYEDIVADKEAQARRLIEYCGLAWDDACIDFHKNKRAIHTASVVQVRQPIYTSSVTRWKPYEDFLAPLIDALGISREKLESPHQ
ncbi:MAG: sulfotransferase [Pseudomonadota bacterium]